MPSFTAVLLALPIKRVSFFARLTTRATSAPADKTQFATRPSFVLPIVCNKNQLPASIASTLANDLEIATLFEWFNSSTSRK